MKKPHIAKKIVYLHNKSIELKKRIEFFHDMHKINKREINQTQLNYLLSFLTMASYLHDYADFLLKNILNFQKEFTKPFTKKQVYILINAKRRLKILKESQKYYLE